MKNKYKNIFDTIVEETVQYVKNNNIGAIILGISGGIDSTVCAAICREVSDKLHIPLIGRSLPTNNNKDVEVTTADLVGEAFCNNYLATHIQDLYETFIADINMSESWLMLNKAKEYQTKIANGNLQARIRMIYLYNLASLNHGIVIDTDNLTEHNLGYWTLHGDVGDFNPIGGLWKTEVFELAKWIAAYYYGIYQDNTNSPVSKRMLERSEAIQESLKLVPTAGLGITNSDLEEMGAESYEQVDGILQKLLEWRSKNTNIYANIEAEKIDFINEHLALNYPLKVIKNIVDRHYASDFKRHNLPVVITRNTFGKNV